MSLYLYNTCADYISVICILLYIPKVKQDESCLAAQLLFIFNDKLEMLFHKFQLELA